MNSIEWKEQHTNFGLDYSTKTGKWEDWRFDIRYDYDGNPKEKPEKCVLWLTIYKSFSKVYSLMGYDIDELVMQAEVYMLEEKRKFLNANFG